MRMDDEAGLGLAVHWIQQALITAYEDNCPFSPSKNGRKSLKWTSELESLRREVRRLFNRCQADNKSSSWELYRERLNRDIGRRYGRRYGRLPKRPGGPSVAPLTIYPSQQGYTGLYLGTLKLGWDPWWLLPDSVCNLRRKPWISLLATHFPDSVAVEGGVIPAAVCCATHVDWRVAERTITCHRVEWAIDSFTPYKSPGMDRIFPPLLQEGQGILILYLVRIFRACLVTEYVPVLWRQV